MDWLVESNTKATSITEPPFTWRYCVAVVPPEDPELAK